MKETDASLMAKVHIKLARAANSEIKQFSSYMKAKDILDKDTTIESSEIIIEICEFLLRYPVPDQQ